MLFLLIRKFSDRGPQHFTKGGHLKPGGLPGGSLLCIIMMEEGKATQPSLQRTSQ